MDDATRNTLIQVVNPRSVETLRSNAYRLKDINDSLNIRKQFSDICEATRLDYLFTDSLIKFSELRLIATDMDSTLIDIECIDEIANFIGRGKEVSAITAAAMSGEMPDFTSSLRHRVKLLAGADAKVLRRVYEERFNLTDGAELLIHAAKKYNIYVLLVSGGFTYFTELLKESLGLNAALANKLEIKGGRLTGRILGPVIDGNAKAHALSDTLSILSLSRKDAMAIGDGENDIPMLNVAATSVAFHAKKHVNAVASAKIKFGGLDVILDYYD